MEYFWGKGDFEPPLFMSGITQMLPQTRTPWVSPPSLLSPLGCSVPTQVPRCFVTPPGAPPNSQGAPQGVLSPAPGTSPRCSDLPRVPPTHHPPPLQQCPRVGGQKGGVPIGMGGYSKARSQVAPLGTPLQCPPTPAQC